MTKRFLAAAAALALMPACGSDSGSSSSVDDDVDEGPRRGDGGTQRPRDASRDARDTPPYTGSSCNRSDPVADGDDDGFTIADGDCNDCDPLIGPGAYDYPGDAVDDDCSGSAASASEAECDGELAIDSTDAQDGARALGLCTFTAQDSRAWGVLGARYTDASGTSELATPLAVGVLPSFGAARPEQGASFLALSSGVARAPDQPGATADCDTFGASRPLGGLFGCQGCAEPPPGYPKESSSCRAEQGIFSLDTVVMNQAALELTIRVPTNASSLSFDSIFYTMEYPGYVCSEFNDFYVVFKEPKPDGVGDGNIVFDGNGDPIGVNTGLLAVCDPSIQEPDAPKQFTCPQGTGLLTGTGFGAGETRCASAGDAGGAATGWLHTTAPVVGGQVITLRFAVWDTNDPILDSTVLIDNFKWSLDDADVGTNPILI